MTSASMPPQCASPGGWLKTAAQLADDTLPAADVPLMAGVRPMSGNSQTMMYRAPACLQGLGAVCQSIRRGAGLSRAEHATLEEVVTATGEEIQRIRVGAQVVRRPGNRRRGAFARWRELTLVIESRIWSVR